MSEYLKFLLCLLVIGCIPLQGLTQQGKWWKGNLHTHSLWSDGDDYPEMIMAWYKEHGYHFVALSDHNMLAEGEKWEKVNSRMIGQAVFDRYLEKFGEEWVETRERNGRQEVRLKTLAEYRSLFEEKNQFLVIKAEEITSHANDKAIHVNATNVQDLVKPAKGESVQEVLQQNLDAVWEQRAATKQPMFPHVNHPNFFYSISVEDMISLNGARFFEVYNGHPLVHNEGDAKHPSTERMWDLILHAYLNAGKPLMYGLAVDDSHNYYRLERSMSNPGRGWIVVKAKKLTPKHLIKAMEKGDFYASTGVELAQIKRVENTLEIKVKAEEGVKYRIEFLGSTEDNVGVLFKRVNATEAKYTMLGYEQYVRVKITSDKKKENPYSLGEVEKAWTQPVQPL